MPDRRRPSTSVRRRRARSLGLLALSLLAVYLYAGPVRSYVDARSNVARDRAQVSRLRQANARLHTQIGSLRSFPTMMGLARQNGWVRPGEKPYSISG